MQRKKAAKVVISCTVAVHLNQTSHSSYFIPYGTPGLNLVLAGEDGNLHEVVAQQKAKIQPAA